MKEQDILIAMPTNMEWIQMVHTVCRNGRTSAPRGKKIREMLGGKVVLPMELPLLTIKGRNMGYRFAMADAHNLLCGGNTVEALSPYNRRISEFSDDGETFFGAYGPKIADQFLHVLNTLSEDQDSRQAVINIWRENPPKSKDIPCTLDYQFLIRGGALHVIQYMRSSDIWLGLPYDIFNAAMLGIYILLHLRGNYPELRPGTVCNFAGSRHIYVEDMVKFERLMNEGDVSEIMYDPIEIDQFGGSDDLLLHLVNLRDRNFHLMKGEPTGYPVTFLRELQNKL
jgi:thymidylate synthase